MVKARKANDKTLRARAYEALEEAIVTQVLAPGSRVTEVELSNRLDIGRTPIREALQRLAREGLVSIHPRAAIVIQEMTLERLLQLLELRGAAELLLATSATVRATLEERSLMLQLASAVEDAAGIDAALYLRVVRDINTLLCDSARNEFLHNVMLSIYALSRQFAYAYSRQPEARKRSAKRHADILRAVASQDTEAAERAAADMMAHLRQMYPSRPS